MNSKVSIEDELAVTKLACEADFLFFCRYFFKKRFGFKFIVNWHHRQIAKKLMQVHRGEIKNLVINMPPRYGKTEVTVIMFIAWCIALNSRSKFIHLSYSDDLALDNSAHIKEIIQMEEFQQLWGVPLKSDSQSKKKWYTENDGGLYATAAGGPVTGFGAGSTEDTGFAGAIIIDDPLKPDDADSEKERTKVNKRMNGTIMSRRNNRNTPMIIIMQRLHDEDLCGYVLGGNTGEHWDQLVIPAYDKKTKKALWPHKHTVKELKRMHKADQYVFSSQYQQEAIPDAGIYFKKAWFRRFETKPPHLNNYGGCDYAVSEDQGDFTELGVFGVDPEENIYIHDWVSGQVKSDVWVDDQIDLTLRHGVLMWAGEMGPIRKAVEPWLTKQMARRKCYTILEWFPHNADNYKQANARTFQALCKMGKIYLPAGELWADDLISQLTRFPKGALDDKVDACSLFGRMINDVWKAQVPQEDPEPETDAWGNQLDSDESWKTA